MGRNLITARVVQTTQLSGLCVDGRKFDLQLAEHTEHFVELGVDVWHMRTEGVFVRAAIVALETLY